MTTFSLATLEQRAKLLNPEVGNGLRARIKDKSTGEWSDGDYGVVQQAIARLLSRTGGIIEIRHPVSDDKVTVFVDTTPATV